MSTQTIKNLDRETAAYTAADRIISCMEKAGFYTTVPSDIIDNHFNLPDNIYCEWGASRVVIWDDEEDFVIKIAREKDFEKYNQREVEIYNAAAEEGVEEAFGWCSCYLEPTIDEEGQHLPGVYVMEYLDGCEEDVCENAYNYGLSHYCESIGAKSLTSDIINDYASSTDDEGELLELLESTMDFQTVGRLEKFIYRDWGINDLHGGNMLYRGEQLVICDYAGWGW